MGLKAAETEKPGQLNQFIHPSTQQGFAGPQGLNRGGSWAGLDLEVLPCGLLQEAGQECSAYLLSVSQRLKIAEELALGGKMSLFPSGC